NHDRLSLLEKDLLTPLSERRQEEPCTRGDSPELSSRPQHRQPTLHERGVQIVLGARPRFLDVVLGVHAPGPEGRVHQYDIEGGPRQVYERQSSGGVFGEEPASVCCVAGLRCVAVERIEKVLFSLAPPRLVALSEQPAELTQVLLDQSRDLLFDPEQSA